MPVVFIWPSSAQSGMKGEKEMEKTRPAILNVPSWKDAEPQTAARIGSGVYHSLGRTWGSPQGRNRPGLSLRVVPSSLRFPPSIHPICTFPSSGCSVIIVVRHSGGSLLSQPCAILCLDFFSPFFILAHHLAADKRHAPTSPEPHQRLQSSLNTRRVSLNGPGRLPHLSGAGCSHRTAER